MKKIKKIKRSSLFLVFGILFLILIVPKILAEITEPPEFYQPEPSTPYLYPNAQVNPWAQTPWHDRYCNNTGMDFIIEIEPDACQPSVVRSDLLEEQDVPVLCRMTGIKINPIIQVPYIKSIIPSVENKSSEISHVTFLPARYALSYYAPASQKRPGFEGTPTMSNLGYLLVNLKRQPVESKMPESVNVNLSVRIRYDIARTYGINENQFILPILSNEEWSLKYKNYGFWKGKGYLRLQEITGNSRAKIAVYTNPNAMPFSTKELRVGEAIDKKDEIMLPGFYCGAGVALKLEEISVPKTRARIMVNGDELLLSDGDQIQDSGCYIYNIKTSDYGYGGTVTINCGGVRTLTLKDLEAEIEVDGRGRAVTVGSEIEKGEEEKINVYVGFIGKELTAEGLNDFILLFTKTDGKAFREDIKEKIINAIHEYAKGKRGASLTPESDWQTKIRNYLDKNYPEIDEKSISIYQIRGGSSQEISENSRVLVNIKLISATGPEQVRYSDEIEAIYNEAKNQYRDVAYAYSEQQHSEGMYYGVMSLRAAADLASKLHKEIDQVELLRELIDRYSDSTESKIVMEVEDARDELRRVVSLGGDKRETFSRPNGNYFVELVSIEKPSIAAQSAEIEVNGIRGTYGINSEISGSGYRITNIDETSVRFKNRTGTKETIAIGNWEYLSDSKVYVINTVLRKEAKVTVLPFERERETITNFTVQIGIEKRAIKLSPEKTQEMIEKLEKTIDSLNKINEKLGKVVSVWKKACFAGATALWVKNFVTGLGGESLARKMVMEKWTDICSNEAYRDRINAISISDCYRKKENQITNDINLVKNSLSKTNDFIKEIKSVDGVEKSSGLFGLSKSIDEKKFMEVAKEKLESEFGREYEIEKFEDPSKTIQLKDITDELDDLQKKNYIFKDDIKEMYNNIQLYEACKGKSPEQLEESIVCQGALKETYPKLFKYHQYAIQIKEIEKSAETMKNVGMNYVTIVALEKTAIIKVDKIFTLNTIIEPGIDKVVSSEILRDYKDNKSTIFYSSGMYFLALVDVAGGNRFTVKKLVPVKRENNIFKEIKTDLSDIQKGIVKKVTEFVGEIEEIDFGNCEGNAIGNKYRNVIRFWESGPYEGFVALMPINRATGWYMATTSYTGLEGAMIAWKENADINNFWICNVGPDGVPNFDHSGGGSIGDDCCTLVSLMTGAQPQIPPFTIAKSIDLVEQTKTCARNAIVEYSKGNRQINTGKCGKFTLGKPPVAHPTMQCENFMSPSDCRIMYNLCDPVMCPASRCDFGGRMPVDDVVQSGIIGSLLLCWPNFEDGRGVLVPICLTGVNAGLESFTGILNASRDCLKEQLETGKTIGICDQIMSVYICEFFWRQFDPFIRAGIPALTESLSGRGGGEYALFSESWQQSLDSYRYFTDFYAEESIKAFKARSTAQIGTEICKKFVSVTYPTQAQFWEDISKPESPYQVTAWFDETPMGGASPESHYKVFTYIWAGNDQGVYYNVYLSNPSKLGYYGHTIPEQYIIPNSFGYLSAGQYLALSPDFRAPSGYKEICVNINGNPICGFGQATTNFALQELQNLYLEQQAAKDVKTAKECVSGKPTIIPTATLNIQSAVEHALEPAIYKRGINRVCSTLKPGQGTSEPDRWKRIGYCDEISIGCWLDTKSVENAISDLGIQENILTEAEEKDIAYAIDQYGLDTPEDSRNALEEIKPGIISVEKSVDDFINSMKGMSSEDLKREKEEFEERIKDIDDKEIIPLLSKLREISSKCVRSEEKARAEWDIAKLRDIRARLYAQMELFKFEKENTCEKRDGRWRAECLGDEIEITYISDKDVHPYEKCCVKEEVSEKIPELQFSSFRWWPVKEEKVSKIYSEKEKSITIEWAELAIYGKKYGNVTAVGDGIVKEIGEDYVIIYHGTDELGNDIHAYYGNLDKIDVVEGQSKNERDKIGEVEAKFSSSLRAESSTYDYKFYFRIWMSDKTDVGDSVNPVCFFDESWFKSNIEMPRKGFLSFIGIGSRHEWPEEECAEIMGREFAELGVFFAWPVSNFGDIKDYFGSRGGEHEGIDIHTSEGTLVYAVYDGIVAKEYGSCKAEDCESCNGKQGNQVNIRHNINGKTIYSKYFHLKSTDVKKDDEVKKGDIIGTIGKTGNACNTPAHLHFEIHTNNMDNPKDPLCFFSNDDLSRAKIEWGEYNEEECRKIIEDLGLETEATEIGEVETKTLSELKSEYCPSDEIIYLPANGKRTLKELIVMGTGILDDSLIEEIASEIENNLNDNIDAAGSYIGWENVEKTMNTGSRQIERALKVQNKEGIIECISSDIPNKLNHEDIKLNSETFKAEYWPKIDFVLFTNIPSFKTKVFLKNEVIGKEREEIMFNMEPLTEFEIRVGDYQSLNYPQYVEYSDATPLGEDFNIYTIEHFPRHKGLVDYGVGKFTTEETAAGNPDNLFLDWRFYYHPKTGESGYGFYYHSYPYISYFSDNTKQKRATSWGCVSSYNWEIKKLAILMLRNNDKLYYYDKDCENGVGDGCEDKITLSEKPTIEQYYDTIEILRMEKTSANSIIIRAIFYPDIYRDISGSKKDKFLEQAPSYLFDDYTINGEHLKGDLIYACSNLFAIDNAQNCNSIFQNQDFSSTINQAEDIDRPTQKTIYTTIPLT